MDNLKAFCRESGIDYSVAAPLENYCTFKIGGNADILIEPQTEKQLGEILKQAKQRGIRTIVIGKGSNILFADDGFNGAVILLGREFSNIGHEEDAVIYCQSGASLSQLCKYAMEHELSGLEFAYGIPGSVGGAVYMNAGAYGGEIKDVIVSAKHLNDKFQSGIYTNSELKLSYRHSVYSGNGFVITGAKFRLVRGKKEEIKAKMDEFMGRRKDKQPLELPSSGSTFRRPVGGYASELIDRCGLKGKSVGGAMVSPKHAGFVVNFNNATGADVRELIKQIQDEVFAKTGFALKCEVQFVD